MPNMKSYQEELFLFVSLVKSDLSELVFQTASIPDKHDTLGETLSISSGMMKFSS